MASMTKTKPKGGKRRLLRNLARLMNYDLFEQIEWVKPDHTQHTPAQTQEPVVTDISAPKPRQGELPPVEELYRLFDIYNAIHFANSLPRPTIKYSTRMLAAGSCEPLRKVIKIGVRYHQIFREELEDTLKHEMIHLVHFHHDKHFKAKAAEMGVPVHAKFHPDLKRPPKYLYQCPSCRHQYPRQKRLRETSCGSCSNGAYNPRFKLQLVKKAAC